MASSLTEIAIFLGLGVLLLIFFLLRSKRRDFGVKRSSSLDDELAKVTRVLAANPRNEKALYQAGDILFKKGEYSRAMEHLQLLERVLQKQSLSDYPYLYELYRLLGLSCFQLKDYNRSLEYLTSLRGLSDPRVDYDVLRALGILYFKSKNFPRALSLLSKAWKLNPKEAQLGAYVGVSLAEMGQWKQSVEALERVINILPDDAQLRWVLARGYVRTEQLLPAIKVYQELKKMPDREDEAGLEEARLLLRLRKNISDALAILNGLLVNRSGDSSCEAGYLLGQYYLGINDVTKAVGYFQQVRAKNPEYRDVNDIMRRYSVLLRAPNLFVLMEGAWEQQRTLCRRLVRKYFYGKERLVQELNHGSEVLITITVPSTQGEEPVLLFFAKDEQEMTLDRVRELQNLLTRKGQRVIVHLLGPITAEALEFCNSRHIDLVVREAYLDLLAAVGKIELEE